jgi:uncharacterized membrane protein YczE
LNFSPEKVTVLVVGYFLDSTLTLLAFALEMVAKPIHDQVLRETSLAAPFAFFAFFAFFAVFVCLNFSPEKVTVLVVGYFLDSTLTLLAFALEMVAKPIQRFLRSSSTLTGYSF